MDDEIIKIELNDELDLHPFHPRDVKAVLREFIDMAWGKGIKKIRIAHGKGRSTIKGMVLSELSKNDKIASYHDDSGNWGATIAILKDDDE